ncbi:MAG: DUF805 domain-containing protein [Caulobacteraceae bacterium]
MNVLQRALSFEGRQRRRDFWLTVLVLWVISWILTSIVRAVYAPAVYVTSDHPVMRWMVFQHMSAGFGVVGLILLWPSLANGVKRCHDRDKSGWWMLLTLIPLIGWIWWLIELGFLDGTPGSNRFGPSPKGMGGSEEATALLG